MILHKDCFGRMAAPARGTVSPWSRTHARVSRHSSRWRRWPPASVCARPSLFIAGTVRIREPLETIPSPATRGIAGRGALADPPMRVPPHSRGPSILAIDALAQPLARPEVGSVSGRERHRRPGLGVARETRGPESEREACEASDLDASATGEMRRHLLEHHPHRERDITRADLGLLVRNPADQLRLRHWPITPAVSGRSDHRPCTLSRLSRSRRTPALAQPRAATHSHAQRRLSLSRRSARSPRRPRPWAIARRMATTRKTDVTSCAPMPICLLASVGGDERIVEAHDRAIGKTLDRSEDYAVETRMRDPETGAMIRTPVLAGALGEADEGAIGVRRRSSVRRSWGAGRTAGGGARSTDARRRTPRTLAARTAPRAAPHTRRSRDARREPQPMGTRHAGPRRCARGLVGARCVRFDGRMVHGGSGPSPIVRPGPGALGTRPLYMTMEEPIA